MNALETTVPSASQIITHFTIGCEGNNPSLNIDELLRRWAFISGAMLTEPEFDALFLFEVPVEVAPTDLNDTAQTLQPIDPDDPNNPSNPEDPEDPEDSEDPNNPTDPKKNTAAPTSILSTLLVIFTVIAFNIF